jgi:hypothetical protein
MSNASDLDIFVSEYSDKSFKVEGKDTKDYRHVWKSLGGRFNFRLKGGPGWVISKKKEDELLLKVDQIRSGVIDVVDVEEELKVKTLKLIDLAAKNMKQMPSEDRKELHDYIKATFYF